MRREIPEDSRTVEKEKEVLQGGRTKGASVDQGRNQVLQIELRIQVRGAIWVAMCELYAFWLNKHDSDLCSGWKFQKCSRFLDFFKNRPAAHELPSGDTCVCTKFFGFPYELPSSWGWPAKRRILHCPISLFWLVCQWWCGV